MALEAKAQIVVIDDEELMRSTFQEVLGRYNVVTFDNAADGAIYVWYNRAAVDLILLDLHMEATGANGDEFFKRIRSIPDSVIRTIPILIVTSVANKDDVMRVVKLNPDGYILKPFNNEVLLGKIEVCLRTKAKRSV